MHQPNVTIIRYEYAPDTLKLINRWLDYLEGKQQEQIDQLDSQVKELGSILTKSEAELDTAVHTSDPNFHTTNQGDK